MRAYLQVAFLPKFLLKYFLYSYLGYFTHREYYISENNYNYRKTELNIGLSGKYKNETEIINYKCLTDRVGGHEGCL